LGSGTTEIIASKIFCLDALIAGIIAAIIPAIKASRQNILEAISYE